MFCKFCGKEIPNGGICECQEAMSGNTVQQSEQVQQTQQVRQSQQSQVLNDIKDLLLSCKNILLNFFRQPIDTVKQVYINNTNNEAYVIGGAFVVLAFITCMVLTRDFADYIEPAKIGFWFAMVLLVEKLLFGGMLYVFTRKYSVDFKRIIRIVCLTTIQLSVCLLLMILFSCMGVVTGIVIVAIIFVLADILNGIIVIDAVFENKNVGYWIYVAITCVIITVGYIIVRNVVMTAVNEMINSISSLNWLF